MKLKKELARRIVADFHGAEAATRAAEDWARQFQRDETPEQIEQVAVKYTDVAAPAKAGAVKLDKLLSQAGLAGSVSDGLRKIKAKSVRVDGEVKLEPILHINLPTELTIRVGRLLKKVVIS